MAKPGYCEAHFPLIHRDYGRARRGFDAEVGFYQSRDWRTLRSVVPLKDGGARFDRANLQPLCVSCHNRKTARETAGRR
jgi:5-methylcytosine-specific restriction protein A